MEAHLFDGSIFQFDSDQLQVLLPYLWLCLGIFAGVIAAAFRAPTLVMRGLLLGFLLPFALWLLSQLKSPEFFLFGNAIEVDALARLSGAAIALLAGISVCFGGSTQGKDHSEWGPLTLISVLAMSLLPASRNWMSFFITLETMAIAGYVLTALGTRREQSLEAGLKYLFMGAYASAVMLMGFALLYGATGSLSFEAIKLSLATISEMEKLLALAGGILITVGILFKVAQVPFHMWAADVYQAAPTSSGAFLASGTKLSVFCALMAALVLTGVLEERGIKALIYASSILSILVGNFLAMAQTRLKRMLAYSGVANAGYVGLALVVGTQAAGSMLTSLFVYGVGLLTCFAAADMYARALGREDGYDPDIKELPVAARSTTKAASFLMAIGIFSIAGIPPLPGFLAKYLLLKQLWVEGLYAGAGVMILGSLLGIGYYLRILVPVYMLDRSDLQPTGLRVAKSALVAASFGALSLLVMTAGFGRLAGWFHLIEGFAR